MALALRSFAGKCALVAGTLAAAVPMNAKACTLISVTQLEPDGPIDNSRECREIWRDREQILEGLQNGSEDYSDYGNVAFSFAEGKHGCGKRSKFAFQLADAAVGAPVRAHLLYSGGRPSLAIRHFHDWAPNFASQDRRAEVATGAWLLSENSRSGSCGVRVLSDRLPTFLTEPEIHAALVKPEYWGRALKQFGNNPPRDRLILRELMAPSSPYFDL